MRELYVDPGKRALGWAMWSSTFAAGLIRTKQKDFGRGLQEMVVQLPPGADRVVVELPRHYPYERRIRVNDLIDLAAVAGACGAAGPVEFVHPATWKGQTPKPISHHRVRKALTAEERAVLEQALEGIPESLQHNVLDAVGIGLWRRGRRGGHV
jgi:hypothetical protein